MFKKLLVILFSLVLTGCLGSKKFYLDDIYYNSGNFVDMSASDINEKGNFVLYTYNSYCNFPIPCEDIFKKFMEKYKIDFISMPFDKFKKTSFYKKIKYAPSIIIIKNGKVVDYLDANEDRDTAKYQDYVSFKSWISKYIYVKKY